MYEVSDTFVTF